MATSDTNFPNNQSEFSAALHAKCPKCRKGDMFQKSSLGFLSQKMNTRCPYCNFQFEIEPGYFYVAMFVSYGMVVAEMVTVGIATYILTHSESPWLYIGVLLGVAFLLSPFNYRFSRVILLYWLTPNLHYDPEKAKKPYNEQ